MTADAAAVVRAVAWALAHFVWQGAALWLALVVVRAATRGASPRVRYACACAALAAMALAPVATAARLLDDARGEPVAAGTAAARPAPASATAGVRAMDERGGAGGGEDVAPPPLAERARAAVSRWEARAAAGVTAHAPLILAAWALGALALSARLAGGLWLALRVARLAHAPAPDGWDARIARLRARLRVSAPVRLVSSSLVHVPSVIGWLRPVILVPAAAFAGLPPAQLELLLAHELAHVRRHDWLVNVVQSAVETLLFFHPAVWRVSAWVREEREHCCDDVAAAVAASPLAYVRALADMAAFRAESGIAPAGAPALSLGADGGPLLRRIVRLTAPDRAARPASGPLLAALVALGALGAALWARGRAEAAVWPPAALASGALGVGPAGAGGVAPAVASRRARAVDSAAAALLARAGAPGVVVVQDVRGGAVLSLASYAPPGTDAPDVGAGAVPASVWKLTLAAIWWDAGLGDAPAACTPRLRMDGHLFTGAPGPAGRRLVAPGEMLVTSCTSAAARMALRLRDTLGADGVRAAYARLGFRLGAADEGARDTTFWGGAARATFAVVPEAPVLRAPRDDGAWAALAVGADGVRVSPLHVARLLQAIGNDGVALPPTPPGAATTDASGRGVRVMRAETARRLRAAMRDVVHGAGGTAAAAAPRLAGSRWSLGGKTGTTRTPGRAREDGWFAGLVDDDAGSPRYAVVVRLDGAGPGGGAAALLAADLTRALAGAH